MLRFFRLNLIRSKGIIQRLALRLNNPSSVISYTGGGSTGWCRVRPLQDPWLAPQAQPPHLTEQNPLMLPARHRQWRRLGQDQIDQTLKLSLNCCIDTPLSKRDDTATRRDRLVINQLDMFEAGQLFDQLRHRIFEHRAIDWMNPHARIVSGKNQRQRLRGLIDNDRLITSITRCTIFSAADKANSSTACLASRSISMRLLLQSVATCDHAADN